MSDTVYPEWFYKEFDKIVKIEERLDDTKSSFIKNIMLIMSGLIAVLASLKPDEFVTEINQSIYTATLIMLCLSVILGAVTQYRLIDETVQSLSFHKESLLSRLSSGDTQSTRSNNLKRVCFYKTVSVFFYTFSITSIVLICVYGLTS